MKADQAAKGAREPALVGGPSPLNKSVCGTPTNVTGGVGLGLFLIGMVLFAVAMRASSPLPRTAGVLLALGLPLFAVGSVTGDPLDKVGSILLIGVGTWIALRVWHTEGVSSKRPKQQPRFRRKN